MKNSEIHKGLSDEHIRDFFGKLLMDLSHETPVDKSLKWNNKDPFQSQIDEHINIIKRSELEITRLKSIQSVLTVITKMNWRLGCI